MSIAIKDDIIKGGYWFTTNNVKLDLLIICTGVIVGEVLNCLGLLKEENLNIGVFIATSPDELFRDWSQSIKSKNRISHLENNLSEVGITVPIITIIDGHP